MNVPMTFLGLPDSVTPGMVAAVLLPVAVVTVALRALPFSFLRLLKDSPFITFLGSTMPVGVMTVLVVYSVASLSVSGSSDVSAGSPSLWPPLIASAVTLGLHAWCRRAGLSILVGTGLYMILVNAVF